MTAANALNNRDSEVSAAVSAKVKRKAAALGYVKNQYAASLASRKSNTISLILVNAYCPVSQEQETDINPFYGELILRFERAARIAGYRLDLYGGGEHDYVNFVLEQNAIAAVLVGSIDPKTSTKLSKQGIPILLLDFQKKIPRCINVYTDEVHGGFIAAEHLITKCGCRRLAFLGDTKKPAYTVPRLRRKGAKRACSKYGVEIVDLYHLTSFEDGRAAAGEVAMLGVDGVVTAADTLAAGLIEGLAKLKIPVPKKIRVVGYDNVLLSRTTRPALTTIDQGLGDKINAIIDVIKNGAPSAARVVIKPRLVVRDSA